MVRLRFAPSPTGFLHVGGARTAIFNWLYARHHGGKFILRIEDTDRARSTQESVDAILEGMQWLGIDYDEEPIYQSERTDIYLEHVNTLLSSGKAYRCVCSSELLDEKRKKAMSEGRKPKYDGTCRNLDIADNGRFVVRFRADAVGETVIEDSIRGNVCFQNKELDDFIILRSDGSPTYNLVVTIDDAMMNITKIIRGDDHINNTPKQVMLYKALGYDIPSFAHVPMILGADKSRLSKRHGATSVMAYRDMGYLPEAMLNYLVRLGWSYGDEEIFSREDLIEKFSLENIGKSAGVFNNEKLNWLNAHYIKGKSLEEIVELIIPHLQKMGITEFSDKSYIGKVVKTLQTRSKTIAEMAEYSLFYFTEDYKFDEKAKGKFLKEDVFPLISSLSKELEALNAFEESDIESAFKAVETEYDIKLRKLAQPVRVALTGTKVSPGLFEVIWALGKERTLSRLRRVSA